MGGYNSRRPGAKRSTANMHALDIRKIQRAGLLKPGQFGSWQWTRSGNVMASISIRAESGQVNLTYRTRNSGGEWQDMDYPVQLTSTACNYGGERAWWLCPVVGCGRRVAVLFGGKVYACRHCQNLNYESTRSSPNSRLYARADKVRRKMGWCAGIANPPGDRPKGMHRATYLRLLNQLNARSIDAMGSSDKVLARLAGKLRGIDGY